MRGLEPKGSGFSVSDLSLRALGFHDSGWSRATVDSPPGKGSDFQLPGSSRCSRVQGPQPETPIEVLDSTHF